MFAIQNDIMDTTCQALTLGARLKSEKRALAQHFKASTSSANLLQLLYSSKQQHITTFNLHRPSRLLASSQLILLLCLIEAPFVDATA